MIIAAIGSGIFNLVFWLAMYFSQWWEVKKGRIPAKSKSFLYLESFNTSGWGDLIGLTMVDIAVGALIVHTWTSDFFIPTIIGFGVAGVLSAVAFAMLCLRPSHQPDAGYPAAGHISWQGKVHLVYFGFQFAYGFLGFALLARTFLSGTALEAAGYIAIGLLGLLVYVVAFIRDMQQGNFAPASKQETYSVE